MSSFSRYLNFCLDFLVLYKNDLIRKVRFISRFMSQQTIQCSYSPISQDLKAIRQWNFVSSYNIAWGTFLLKNHVEKSYTQCVGETIPRSFSEKSKLTVYLWINSLKFYTVWFNWMHIWGLWIHWKWLKLSCRSLVFTL